jgi:hypothetical protein
MRPLELLRLACSSTESLYPVLGGLGDIVFESFPLRIAGLCQGHVPIHDSFEGGSMLPRFSDCNCSNAATVNDGPFEAILVEFAMSFFESTRRIKLAVCDWTMPDEHD